MSDDLSSRARALAAPVAIAVLALVLRTWALGRDDFWSDEVHTFEAIALAPADLVAERLAAGHQPLYFLALQLWSEVAGLSEAALRLPSALVGTLVLWPAYRLVRDLAGRPAALWSSLFLALQPVLVELSREARMYPFVLLAIVGAAAAVASALRTGRVGWGYWAALLLGPLLHASWGLALVGLTAWVLWECGRADGVPERAVRRQLLRGLVVSGLLVVAGVFLAGRAASDLARREWYEEVAVYALRQVSGAGILRAHAVVHFAAFMAWAGAVFLGWSGADGRVRRFAITFFLGVHVAGAVAALAFGVGWGPVRYVQAALLPLLVLAGVAVATARVRDRRLGLVLAAGLVGVGILLHGLRFGSARTQWSDTAMGVLDGDTSRVEALAGTPDEGARIVLRHYLAHPRVGREAPFSPR